MKATGVYFEGSSEVGIAVESNNPVETSAKLKQFLSRLIKQYLLENPVQ